MQLFRAAPERVVHDSYLLKDILAQGRVTTVYRALDVRAAATSYAIKEISSVALFRSDERREAREQLFTLADRWSRVEHPGLVRLIDCFAERDRFYVVFEYVPGWSGDRIIAEPSWRVTPDLARNWGAQIADVLATLHRQEPPLFAPFLSPAHIIVMPSGVVKVVGLGLGRLFCPVEYGPFGATRGYYPGDLEGGSPEPSTDGFTLGRMLYALLIKYPLERGLPKQMPLRQVVPAVSAQLAKVIARAAHRDQAQRYTDLGELRDALWETARGPLAPIAGWFQMMTGFHDDGQDLTGVRTSVVPPERVPAPAPAVAVSPAPSMADLGFVPDVRYGQRPTTPAEPPAVPRISAPPEKYTVQPRELAALDLKADEERRLVLRVRNLGEADLVARVTSHVPWIRSPGKEFRVPASRQAQVIVTVRASALEGSSALEPQALSIQATASRQWVSVRATKRVGPLLAVVPPVLDYGRFETDGQRTLEITAENAGGQPLAAQVQTRVGWLSAAPASFRCAPGARVAVRVTADVARLPRGPQSVADAVAIDSDGGQALIAVQAWRPAAHLDLVANHLDFGIIGQGQTLERKLGIRNLGDGEMVSTIRSLIPELHVVPERITCAPGDLVEVTAVLDGAGLTDGPFHVAQALRIQGNGGNAAVPVSAVVAAPVPVLPSEPLDFGLVARDQSVHRQVAIRNEGSAPLVGVARSNVPWLSPAEMAFVCPPRGAVALEFVVEGSRFLRGQSLDAAEAVRIEAGGATGLIASRGTVLLPTLHVEPESIDFGYIGLAEPVRRVLTIANDGTGILGWTVQTDALWVEVSPTRGECAAGEISPVMLTAYGLALDTTDVNRAAVAVSSDGGRVKVPISAGLAAPLLDVDPIAVDLGLSINRAPRSASVRLTNRGLGMLRGTLRSDRLWLALDRVSFECDTGRSVEVRVHSDMDEFPPTETIESAAILVESNGGVASVPVRLALALQPELESGDGVSLAPSAEGWQAQGRLVLRNTGLAPAHVFIEPSAAGIVVSRPVVDIKPGKSVRVAVMLEHGASANDALILRVRCGASILAVPVRLVATITDSEDEGSISTS